MDKKIPLAIEFIGVIGELKPSVSLEPRFDPDAWKPRMGVKQALQSLADRDYYVMIHTPLVSEDLDIDLEDQVRKLEAWLSRWGLVWDSIWLGVGKPNAVQIETVEDLEKYLEVGTK